MADWDGTRYGEVSALQREMAAESLSLLHLQGDEDVLDVGCGDGYYYQLRAELRSLP